MKMFILRLCLSVVVLLAVTSGSAFALTASLSWVNTNNTDNIQIEKSNSMSGPFSLLVQLPINSSSYVDTANNAGETACYRIAYYSANGIGPYAGPVCKTFPAPAPPSQTPGAFAVN